MRFSLIPNWPDPTGKRPKGGVTVEGQQWYDKNGNPVYEEDVQTPNEDVQIEETEPTWAEKTGRFKGEEKQGEEAGKYRAKAQQEIGDSQLGLSHSGAVLGQILLKILSFKRCAIRFLSSKISN